jgi:hypothetical protein
MRISHLATAAAAVVATLLALPAPAHADAVITQPFAATSGDACGYGFTEGTLTWRFGSTSPLPLAAVGVKGRLTDRPLPADPSTVCRDDGFFSIAAFAAFAGTVEVDREARRVNNGVVSFEFLLGDNSTVSRISRVVIQVCRQELISPTPTPAAYCGRAVEYPVPPIA